MTQQIITLLCLLLIGLPAFGRGHARSGRSHSTRSYRAHSSRSYSRHSYRTRSGPRRPVHVGTYTRRGGTVVHSHSRRLPGTAPKRSTIPRIHYASPRTHRGTRSGFTAPRTHYASPRIHGTLSSHHGQKRSAAAKDAFKRLHPCPSTGKRSGACPGYVIDHRVALACGGADSPSNMQWQTVAEAKAKDRYERKGCR